MIWRLIFYGVALLMAATAPRWWSGFAMGVSVAVLLFDVGTWDATRRHRKESKSRVEEEGLWPQ